MAFVPSFTYSQNYGTITTATFTDASTDNPGVTDVLVYLQKNDGTYLTPSGSTTDYIFWPSLSTPLNIICLDKDYALSVTMKYYLGSTLNTTKTILCLFRAYNELQLRQLTQAQEGNNKLLSNANFWDNKSKLRELVDSAIQAVSVLNSQAAATYALDTATDMIANISNFF